MNPRGRTLIVTAATPAPEGGPPRPSTDYEALRNALDADLLHAGLLRRRWPRLLRGIALARATAERAGSYDNVYCDSEHIAVPLAAMLRARRPRLTMIAHYLTPGKKRAAIRLLRIASRFAAVVLHSPAQLAPARAAGFEERQLRVVPYQVDAAFWQPTGDAGDYVMSAGREFRDYRTLLQAVEGLSLTVRIAAGSHWSRRKMELRDVPGNVAVQPLPYDELRAAYAGAAFAVVPLHDVDFQAGIITILEAMAMGKAVIVSRTRGQTGTVSGPLMEGGRLHDIGEHAWPEPTGIYVPPGDAGALRDAIVYLSGRPDLARKMGAAGRRHVEAHLSLDWFTARMTEVIAPAARSQALVAAR
jgi:glycosyltransferase involved in cell wall biosynthesis